MAEDLAPEMTLVADTASATIQVRGPVTIYTIGTLQPRLADLPRAEAVALDLTGVSRLDTAGAWWVMTLRERIEATGAGFGVLGLSDPNTQTPARRRLAVHAPARKPSPCRPSR